MYLRHFFSAIAGLTLVACVDAGDTNGPVAVAAVAPITTETEFRQALVGRTIGFEGSTFVINANGTVSGPWDGSGITGTWNWDGSFWCRDIAIGGVSRAPDCQLWTVSGNSATVVRDRGTGSSFVYTIR